MSRVFANGLQTGILSQRLKKMLLDANLLNTQHYKERIKGKGKQSREWSSVLPSPTPRCSSY